MALSLITEVSLAYKWRVTAATGGGFASQAAPPCSAAPSNRKGTWRAPTKDSFVSCAVRPFARSRRHAPPWRGPAEEGVRRRRRGGAAAAALGRPGTASAHGGAVGAP